MNTFAKGVKGVKDKIPEYLSKKEKRGERGALKDEHPNARKRLSVDYGFNVLVSNMVAHGGGRIERNMVAHGGGRIERNSSL